MFDDVPSRSLYNLTSRQASFATKKSMESDPIDSLGDACEDLFDGAGYFQVSTVV